jgi:hypothetical protein
MMEPRVWAKGEVVDDNPNHPGDEDESNRLWANPPSDEESEWEKGLSAADRRVGIEWIRRVEMADLRPGTRCRNCRDEKPYDPQAAVTRARSTLSELVVNGRGNWC